MNVYRAVRFPTDVNRRAEQRFSTQTKISPASKMVLRLKTHVFSTACISVITSVEPACLTISGSAGHFAWIHEINGQIEFVQ